MANEDKPESRAATTASAKTGRPKKHRIDTLSARRKSCRKLIKPLKRHATLKVNTYSSSTVATENVRIGISALLGASKASVKPCIVGGGQRDNEKFDAIYFAKFHMDIKAGRGDAPRRQLFFICSRV